MKSLVSDLRRKDIGGVKTLFAKTFTSFILFLKVTFYS